MKKTRLMLFASIFAITLVAMSVGAATMAYFSDSETSSVNILTAGTMDLQIDANPDGSVEDWVDDPNVPTINDIYGALVDNLKPGYSANLIVGIKNAGSIDGKADIHITGVNDHGEDLASRVDVKISYGDKKGTTAVGDDVVSVVVGWSSGYDLMSINSLSFDAPVTLEAGDDDYWVIELKIDGSVANIIQGDHVSFNIEFTLHQEP